MDQSNPFTHDLRLIPSDSVALLQQLEKSVYKRTNRDRPENTYTCIF